MYRAAIFLHLEGSGSRYRVSWHEACNWLSVGELPLDYNALDLVVCKCNAVFSIL